MPKKSDLEEREIVQKGGAAKSVNIKKMFTLLQWQSKFIFDKVFGSMG